MKRVINGLKWAALAARPSALPIGRPRGQKAWGVRYEREVAAAISVGIHGQWFKFEDSAGVGVCQTDLLLDLGTVMLVLEVKYTWTAEGHFQLDRLYQPVVEMVFGKPAIGVVVCKKLIIGMPAEVKVAADLKSVIGNARAGEHAVLHWLGVGVLQPLLRPVSSGHRVSIVQSRQIL